jgi:hypothetical protein
MADAPAGRLALLHQIVNLISTNVCIYTSLCHSQADTDTLHRATVLRGAVNLISWSPRFTKRVSWDVVNGKNGVVTNC